MNKKYYPYLLPIRSVVFILIFIIGSAIVNKELKEISNWWTVIATIVNICTIFILVVAAKSGGTSYKEVINYQKGKTRPGIVIKMCLIILVVGMAGMFMAGFICYGVIPYAAPMIIAPIPKALAIINAVFLPITTALSEDALYLGYGTGQIKNKTAAILIPAFFFSLQHCFIPTLFDVKYILYRFLSFLPLTIILCRQYYKDKNPLPIMIGHALIDVATVMQILATSVIPGFYDKFCSM